MLGVGLRFCPLPLTLVLFFFEYSDAVFRHLGLRMVGMRKRMVRSLMVIGVYDFTCVYVAPDGKTRI